jgi:hypothetical protein
MARSDGHASLAGSSVNPPTTAKWGLTGRTLVRALAFAFPLAMFVTSLRVFPEVMSDSGCGFLVLRSMQRGAGFNVALMPDPSDITRDVGEFQTWWSPGQYLIPGFFESLGLKIGVAISVTILLGTVLGLAGWLRVASAIGAPRRVATQLVLALATVHFVQAGFRVYHGGEVLLFAAAPWALLAVLYALQARPLVAFGVTLVAGALLFFAKLTGLVVLAAVVSGASLVDIASHRRLRTSVMAIWIAAIVLGLLVQGFWLSRGATPVTAAAAALSPCAGMVATQRYNPIPFSIAAAGFSGVSGLTMVASLASRPLPPVLPHVAVPVLALLAVGLMGWVWWCLRTSAYRHWMFVFGAIILSYTGIVATFYLIGSEIDYDERHLRFAGVLVFLLLLVAAATRTSVARHLGLVAASFFGLYGLASYATGVPRILHEGIGDPMSGVTVRVTSPAAVAYLREQQRSRATQAMPVAVVPVQVATNLRGFRILPFHAVETTRWSGRVDEIYVVPRNDALSSARVDSLLKAFAGYDRGSWRERRFGAFMVFSQ